MTGWELLRRDADYGYAELTKSLEGLTEAQSWSVLPPHTSDYLHSEGSIYGIILHVASGKWMNGSICFRDTELRWRECADQMAAFEPDLSAALDYLERGHRYWMASWENLDDLESLRPTHQNDKRPAWWLIQMVSQHDSYHAGQITVLRYALGETGTPPPSSAEDIRTHCRDLAAW